VTANHLVYAFVIAIALSTLATPIARALAVRTNILDRPGEHKSHSRVTPYLGGLAIIVAAHAGTLAGHAIDSTTGRVLMVATLLGAVGLLDDSFPLRPLPRLGCQVAAAAVILGAGVRFEVLASPVADGVVSVVWLVVVTNALNLVDNMDGLCAGTAAIATLGVAGVALAAGQVSLAVTAVAITGACIGFLSFNWRPAIIFMGDAGSMFLGASVAALTLAVHPPGGAAARIIVPLLIIGLPALDTTTVTLGRARRGISVMQGGRDHLSHRLVAQGLRRRTAVRLLLAVELVGVALAIATARGLLNAWVAFGVAAVPFFAVWAFASRPRVYDDPLVGLPHKAWWALLGGAAVVIALSAPAAWAMLRARSPLELGAAQVQAGIQREQAGDGAGARQDFALAVASFSTARDRLHGFGVAAGRVVPVVAVNLRAATTVAGVGLEISRSGQDLAASTDLQTLRMRQGQVPLDTLTSLTPTLDNLTKKLTRASAQVHRLPRTLLVPPIRRGVGALDSKLATASQRIRQSADAANMLPAMLGADGSRRYLLVMQNNAESRATGGFIGNFGELIAQSGRVSLGRFDRIQALDAPLGTDRTVSAPADYLARYSAFYPFDVWQNVNLSPDFPTVGSIIASLYPQSGGTTVDGVIAVDPVALSDLLRLTGPIHVAGWPTEINADNVVQVTLQGAYDALTNEDARAAFLGNVAMAAFAAATQGDIGNPVELVHTLGPAVTEHHIQIYLSNPSEEAFASRLGAAGAVVPSAADRFLLTTQNAAANKVDYYLQRSVEYDLAVSPPVDLQGSAEARVTGRLTVTLTNHAPASGHDIGALGPYEPPFVAGENRLFLSMYTRLAVQSSSLNGAPLALQAGTELGQNVYSAYVDLPPGATRTLTFRVNGEIPLLNGSYGLLLPRQPTLSDDHVTVKLSAPSGWELKPSSSGSWSRNSTVSLDQSAPQSEYWRLRRTGPLSWLDPVANAPAPVVG
jgi:UDP-GlcNAc:undecaprenyl-phosphate GlcNAc-1-phosphate transferase